MIFLAWKHSQDSKQHGLGAEWVRATWVCRTWREVALDAAALWSSILVSRRLADDPALELHLDRADGVPLDLLVLCPHMSNGDLEDAFRFILSRTKAIKQLQIACYTGQQTAVQRFIKDIGVEIVSLSLKDASEDDNHEWELTPGILPRLRRLALDEAVPTPGALGPLLTLVHLELAFAYDNMQLQAKDMQLSTRLNIFLAACPRLESLRTKLCSMADLDDERENDKFVVALPNLRYLSVEDVVLELERALHSLRLPSLTSFHILMVCEGNFTDDFTICVLPRNVDEVLPPLRYTRCLSLAVGRPKNHLLFRGSAGNTFDDGPDWSITLPDLEVLDEYVPLDPPVPDVKAARLYYLGYNGERFLNRIPDLVEPSRLVELQLHFGHGLPVACDWAQFFAPMCHLRTLGIGGPTLNAAVLAAFRADPGLCGELQDVALCAPAGCQWVQDETRLLLFFRKVVGGWVRKRASAGTGLRSLTVRLLQFGSESGSHAHMHGGDLDSLDAGLAAFPELSDADSALVPAGLAPKLRRDLAWLEAHVTGEVVVEDADCPACSAVYVLPADPESSDEHTDTEGSSDTDDDEP